MSAAATAAEEAAASVHARALASQREMLEGLKAASGRAAKLQAAVESVEAMLKKTSKMASEVPPDVTAAHDSMLAAVGGVQARRRRALGHPDVAALMSEGSGGRLLGMADGARRAVEEFLGAIAPAEVVAASVEAALTKWCAQLGGHAPSPPWLLSPPQRVCLWLFLCNNFPWLRRRATFTATPAVQCVIVCACVLQ